MVLKDRSNERRGELRFMNMKRIIYLLIGPILLVVSSLGLTGVFGTAGAQAIGVSLWMIF